MTNLFAKIVDIRKRRAKKDCKNKEKRKGAYHNRRKS